MRYDAEIRVFDMLDQVHVSVRIFATDGLSHEPPQLVLNETHTLHGRGVDDPAEWLADPLCLVTETLWSRQPPSGGEGGWL